MEIMMIKLRINPLQNKLNKRSRYNPAHMSLPPLGKAPANLPVINTPNSYIDGKLNSLSHDIPDKSLGEPYSAIPEMTILDRNREIEKLINSGVENIPDPLLLKLPK